MTKKDYIILARALKDSKPERAVNYTDSYHVELVRWNVTAENIAFELSRDNPKFDRNRFMTAAGYND